MRGKLIITVQVDGGDPEVADFIAEFNLSSEHLGRLQALAAMMGLDNLATIVGLGSDLGLLMMLQEHAKAAMKELKKQRGWKK